MISEATVVSTVETESDFNIQINENKDSCDGGLYVSVQLGHGVPWHFVQHYAECVCEVFWKRVTFESIDKTD